MNSSPPDSFSNLILLTQNVVNVSFKKTGDWKLNPDLFEWCWMNFPVFQGWNVVVPGPKRAMAIWNHQRWRGRVASESKGCVLFVEVTNIQSFRYVEIQYKLEGFLVGYQSWFSWDESGFIAMKLETREMYTGLYVWFVGIFIGSLRVKSMAPTSFFSVAKMRYH